MTKGSGPIQETRGTHSSTCLSPNPSKPNTTTRRYVAFVDLLGFSDLVKRFPGSLNVEVRGDYEEVLTSSSGSAERFRRFHSVLDRVATDFADASRPERMMVFSDCAFLVYENLIQATTSLARAMRAFWEWEIPVRMCLAKGTCHAERFSVEAQGKFNITRSLFYGDGVVFAAEGEKKAGKGCRIFVHTSLDDEEIKELAAAFPVLRLHEATEHSQYELNYLHTKPQDEHPLREAGDQDYPLWRGLVNLRRNLTGAVEPKVLKHYVDSFAALNRMREQLARLPFPVPMFD